MEELEKNRLFLRTIKKWGNKAQLEMLQEEATELALAVRKYIRKDDESTFVALASEIADVQIMISQIKIMYPFIEDTIKNQENFKLNRLKVRIDESRFED